MILIFSFSFIHRLDFIILVAVMLKYDNNKAYINIA